VGHATVLLELDGVRVLTDPFLRRQPLHLRRHAPPVDPSVVRDLDVVLISHQHLDHLHMPSLRLVARDVPLVVPRGAGRVVARGGFTAIHEVVERDTLRFGAVEIAAVQAVHGDDRRPGAPTAKPLGYVVTGGACVYFAGDTSLFDGMAELTARAIDVALLPIWGWGPKIGAGHMDPDAAARAAALIRPAVAVPIHYGTYFPHGMGARRHRTFTEPPRRFVAATARLAPDVDVRVLAPGASMALGAALTPAPPP
jgi:L-ascorbate metabolism protein UlaG (beta-lactamase superfamily)